MPRQPDLPDEYTSAAALADSARDATKGRVVAYNTVVIRVSPDVVAVRHHYTNIVTFHADGRIYLTTGGWKSATTKAQIHSCLGRRAALSQKNNTWKIVPYGSLFKDGAEFFDGIEVTSTLTGLLSKT